MASAPHHPFATSVLCPSRCSAKLHPHNTAISPKPPVQKQPTLVWKLTMQVGPHRVYPLPAMNPKKGFSRLLLCLQGVTRCSLDAESILFLPHYCKMFSCRNASPFVTVCFPYTALSSLNPASGDTATLSLQDRQQHHCMQPHQILKNTAGNDTSCSFLWALPLPV